MRLMVREAHGHVRLICCVDQELVRQRKVRTTGGDGGSSMSSALLEARRSTLDAPLAQLWKEDKSVSLPRHTGHRYDKSSRWHVMLVIVQICFNCVAIAVPCFHRTVSSANRLG